MEVAINNQGRPSSKMREVHRKSEDLTLQKPSLTATSHEWTVVQGSSGMLWFQENLPTCRIRIPDRELKEGRN